MRVLVAGGGSAGWITAARLDAAINRDGARVIDITVVESPDVGRIGVGEATIPSIHGLLRALGIGEAELVAACDATFKQAIHFRDWELPGRSYWHPFHRKQGNAYARAGLAFLNSDGKTPFVDFVSPQPPIAEADRAPKPVPSKPGEGLTYAYHLDADRFGDHLAARAVARGVRRVFGHIGAVETGEAGISAVRLTDGTRLGADLFVDCTGFRRLLIGRLGARHRSAGDWLLCDRAVAMRVPHPPGEAPRIRPYTVAQATGAGWMWDIGLSGRRGRGYVYASRFLDPAEAEAELRAAEGACAAGLPVRHLAFEVGRLERQWIGNCIAVGLSAGFIEPLESTGLHLADWGAQMLVEHFPLAGNPPALGRRFDALMAAAFDETIDFVNLH